MLGWLVYCKGPISKRLPLIPDVNRKIVQQVRITLLWTVRAIDKQLWLVLYCGIWSRMQYAEESSVARGSFCSSILVWL